MLERKKERVGVKVKTKRNETLNYINDWLEKNKRNEE